MRCPFCGHEGDEDEFSPHDDDDGVIVPSTIPDEAFERFYVTAPQIGLLLRSALNGNADALDAAFEWSTAGSHDWKYEHHRLMAGLPLSPTAAGILKATIKAWEARS